MSCSEVEHSAMSTLLYIYLKINITSFGKTFSERLRVTEFTLHGHNCIKQIHVKPK